MKRRDFFYRTIAAGGIAPAITTPSTFASHSQKENDLEEYPDEEIVIERPVAGRPHAGKVLAVIQPHCDDIAYFAAGTVAKLVDEGYTGYLIRTSNDDAAGIGKSVGERVLNNEQSNAAFAKSLGLKKIYDLGYRNHRMDEYNIQELKGRLIFLFRLLKVDTIVCYDPWGLYEENPDHYVTAKAVEAARWMAGSEDYPEQLEVVQPHVVSERYYFARGPQLVNRVVDIGKYIDKKVQANRVITAQGSGGDSGAQLRRKLAASGKQLKMLGNDDETANANYIKEFMLDLDSENLRGVTSDRIVAKKYGLEWAERFRYIGLSRSRVEEYVLQHVVAK
jgi:LmbE family N-acetylglucosaminyl deacetylase